MRMFRSYRVKLEFLKCISDSLAGKYDQIGYIKIAKEKNQCYESKDLAFNQQYVK